AMPMTQVNAKAAGGSENAVGGSPFRHRTKGGRAADAIAPPQRSYGDRGRALCLAVLAANRGNLKRTARQVGVSRNTLRYWAEGAGAVARRARAMLPAAAMELEDEVNAIARRMLRVMFVRLDDCDALEAAIISCRCTDAAVLLEREQAKNP